jgi:diacylglycerol kinase family enzyme
MSSGRRATLLFNPAAGQRRARRALPAIVALLEERFDLALAPTESPQAGREVARRAIAEGREVLFALGGDGTLNVLAGELAGSAVVLAPLPGGTTNVVALALGLPRDPLAAVRALADGAVRELDLGQFRSPAGEGVFLMQVSGGLDAQVMAELDPRAKRRFGKLAVTWTGLRVWARYEFPEFALVADGERFAVTGFVVANLAEYAGGFEIVPGARADDRQLELLLYRGRSRRAALGFALALARGRHARRRDVEIRRVRSVRLLAPSRLLLQRDGDPFEAAPPFEIGLSPRRLRVLASAIGGQRSLAASGISRL